MLLFHLALVPCLLTSALGIPAAVLKNITAGAWQPAIGSLTVPDSTEVQTSRPLLARPPAPYVYRIDTEPSLFIRFESFGRAVSKSYGDILM